MGIPEVLALAVALAMDAFAVAIVSGIQIADLRTGHVVRLAFFFGLFQALMPLLGWLAGNAVFEYITVYDHWVAFGLLAFVGGKMIWESMQVKEEAFECPDPTRGWSLLFLSVATSIDALAVGLSLAMVNSPILVPAVIIGFVAAGFTAAGMALGCRIGAMWGKRVEVFGGLVLIGIGTKILAEHIFFASS